jgi:hypothetical protein
VYRRSSSDTGRLTGTAEHPLTENFAYSAIASPGHWHLVPLRDRGRRGAAVGSQHAGPTEYSIVGDWTGGDARPAAR